MHSTTRLLAITSAVFGFTLSAPAFAVGSGNLFMGVNAGLVTAGQDDLNELKTRANARDTVNASDLSNAYEIGLEFGYRFDGTMFSLSLRPSYFTQSTDGSGASGSYEYSLSGFSIFPVFRLYPLESDLMRFYLQAGLGYGQATGKIKEASASADFKGSGYGSLVGLGAEFIINPTHVLGLEGNVRYLSYERNLITSRSGTFAANSLTQSGENQEAEMDNRDLRTSMSGIVVMARYVFYY